MSKFKIFLILSLFVSITSCAQTDSNVQYLSASEFKKAIDSGKYLLIDVRTPGEFSQGYISGAINIDLYDNSFTAKMKTITAKNKAVAFYCRSGNRSKVAISGLDTKKIQIIDLNDGIISWQRAGYKLSTAK